MTGLSIVDILHFMKKMNLQEYLSKSDLTPSEFAMCIGVTVKSIHRYLKGERVPEKDIMARIRDKTGGNVTADSFYQ